MSIYALSRGLFSRSKLSIFVLLAFFANAITPIPQARAVDLQLPAPGEMVELSPAFDPPVLKGIKVHPDDPFRFDFILDQGDHFSKDQLKPESAKLIQYFLASLTIPEKDLWVNLSPYEKDRIIPSNFGLTEMGRDLLAEDYMLKQITASLIYPEGATGKEFWKRVYESAEKKYGTTNIPVNTFNKVWILPEKAVVYENAQAGTAYIVNSKLKVMLEQDYLSWKKHMAVRNDMGSMGADIVRQIVIPELTREVNEDRNFAQLRQVYDSLILATWYKMKIKDSILEEVYANKNKVKGLLFANATVGDPEHIYQRYLQAFKKGVFNYIKEEAVLGPASGEQGTYPRKYFSGGFTGMFMDHAMTITKEEPRQVPGLIEVSSGLRMADAAMGTKYKGMFSLWRGQGAAPQPQYHLSVPDDDRSSLWGQPVAGEDADIRDQLIDLINAGVLDAYKHASQLYLGDQEGGIWAAGACRLISDFLYKKFKWHGEISTWIIRYKSENRSLIGGDVDFHDFIVIFFKGHVWLLDPTWQQFLKKSNAARVLPKVLLVDIAHLYEKLDAMKVLKYNRHYWYSGLARDPIVLGRVSKEPLYRGFTPEVPSYYSKARSKLNPEGLFRFTRKRIDIDKDLPPLNIFDARVRMISLDDKAFSTLLSILRDGMVASAGSIRAHFQTAYAYYQQVRLDRRAGRPAADLYDFVFNTYKAKMIEGNHGFSAGYHPAIMAGEKRYNVDIILNKSDLPVLLRVGRLIFYNDDYKGLIQGVDEKFYGFRSFPLLNDRFLRSAGSLETFIADIAGLLAVNNIIQDKTVIDLHTNNGIAGIMAKLLGARDVIFIPQDDKQREEIDTLAGGFIDLPTVYSGIDQIPAAKFDNAVLLVDGRYRLASEDIKLIKPVTVITAAGSLENARTLQSTLVQEGYFLQFLSGLATPDKKPLLIIIANDRAMVSRPIKTPLGTMGRSQYIRKIAEGLDYEEARKFRDAKVNDRLPLPMGFSRNEGTVRNSIDVALDQMDDPKLGNFHDARVSHNVRVMAALYRKYVLSYKKPNWEINTSYSGQLGYFADVGGIGVVIKRFENALRKTDMTVPVAMLLFALPELIDQNNPEALRLKEFRGNNSAFNTEPSLLQASLIRSLFGKAPQRTVSRISWKDNVGGIDLAAAGAGLEVNSTKDIRFHLDPAMLQQLQNNPGFVPVIINTRPVTDLRMFLGIIAPVRVDKSA